MRTCIFILLLTAAFGLQSKACSDVSLDGKWIGYLTQDPAPLDSLYQFEANFEVKDEVVQGQTYIAFVDEPQYYGLIEFEGRWDGRHVYLEELYVVQQYMKTFAYWCMKQISLSIVQDGPHVVLQGNWESDDCGLTAGEVYLERMIS